MVELLALVLQHDEQAVLAAVRAAFRPQCFRQLERAVRGGSFSRRDPLRGWRAKQPAFA